MVLDKIPNTQLFTQRDVRETPSSTATATAVGLTTEPYVLVSAGGADLTNERVLTAGEGIDLNDAGAGTTITVSGEDATTANKGIASFNTQNFSVVSGAVSLKIDDTPVNGELDEPISSNWAYDHKADANAHHAQSHNMASHTDDYSAGEGMDISVGNVISGENASVTNKGIASFADADFQVVSGVVSLDADVISTIDGDSGTATGSVHNIDILGGEGINTVGASNDITISGEDATTANKGIIELATEDEVQTGTDTARAVVPDTLQSVLPPIGTVMAWLKSYTNTPQTLPTGWVECDGATLNDADSVYNGQVIPDLNGGIFLRGYTTSGGTGGSSTHTLTTAQMPLHTHSIESGGGGFAYIGTSLSAIYESGTNRTGTAGLEALGPTESTGSGSAHENKPPYYNVVWIMRIK